MQEFIVNTDGVGKRLDAFVLDNLQELSRSHIKKLIENGEILVNNKLVKSGEKLKQGDIVTANIEQPKELEITAENIPLDIIYQDSDLAVINKQKGMVVHPANGNYNGTLVNALLFHLDELSGINGVIRPGIVHRLDKDTSGLLLIAKNDISHNDLAKQIEEKSCHRYYKAICYGGFKDGEGRIETGFGRSLKDRKQMSVFPLGQGKKAITNYKVLEKFGKYSLVEFKLETGRTHQIRVHSKYMQHPILGDEVYGVLDKNIKTTGQLLHAYKIEFTHPTSGKSLSFTAPLPLEFENALKKLKNLSKN